MLFRLHKHNGFKGAIAQFVNLIYNLLDNDKKFIGIVLHIAKTFDSVSQKVL